MKIRSSKHTLNFLLAGILAAMLLAAAACGSSKSEPPTTTAESTVTTPAPTATTTESPMTTTAPETTVEIPETTTAAPVTTTTAPVTTTAAPVTTTKAPVTTTAAPVTTTIKEVEVEVDVTTVTTPKAPETTPKAPETTPKAPETTPKAPELIPGPTVDATPVSENEILNDAIKAAADKYGADAVQAAVISDGKVSAAGQYGWAVKNSTPLAQDTKIRIASLSKTVVGMVTFRLVDEGKLSLDCDISDYLGFTVKNPYYPDEAITLRTLLSHTSSIVDLTAPSSLSELKTTLSYKSSYRNVKPGSKSAYLYNNFGFDLIGAICETVTDDSLSDLAQAYFFDPMGIDASWIASDLPKEKLANIYRDGGEIGLSIDTQLKNKDATAPAQVMRLYAGGLYISAVDYAKLLTLFMNDGCYGGARYLSSESVEAMKTAQIARNSYSDQCMPVMRCDGLYWQDSLYYHTGSAYGVYALYTFDDTTGTGVVVITTGARKAYDAYGMYAICGDISGKVYKNKSDF